MKNIVALSIVCLASAPALAQTCNSLWVYQPFKSCATSANGPDLSQGTVVNTIQAETGWVKGGSNQTDQCNKVAAAHNETDAHRVIRATATPNGEDSRRQTWDVSYNYKCTVTKTAYPFKTAPNAACGTESKWAAEDIGKSLQGLNGTPICLSCDNVQDVKARLACLKVTVDQVIASKDVAIRAEQLKAVVDSIDKTQAVDKVKNVLGIDETVQLSELKEKVTKAAGELH